MKFTPDQRASLSSIKIEQTTKEAEAYSDPHGAADGTAQSVTMATGGGLVGALIGQAVVANQNRMFKNAEASNFPKLKRMTPNNQGGLVTQELTKTMKNNPFFASRLRSSSPNRLTSKVVYYGLTRTGKANGRLLMSPKIVAEVSILGPDGKSIGRQWLPIVGTSALNLPISDYLGDPALLRRGYREAAQNLGTNFETALAQRTAE